MNKQSQRLEMFWRRMCWGPFPFPLSGASGGLITPSTVHHWNSSRNSGNVSLNQVTNEIKPRFCSHFKQRVVRRMHQCEGKSTQFWCALLKLLLSGTVWELFTESWSCSATGGGQPGWVLETSGPSGHWGGLMGFLQVGYKLAETLLRIGKRHGVHPRVQGQSWRGKNWKKKLWSAADRYPSAFPMRWVARQAGFSLANPLHTRQLRTHWRHLSELEALTQLQAPGPSGRWTTGVLIRVRDVPIFQKNQFSLIILLFLLVLLMAVDLGSSKQT